MDGRSGAAEIQGLDDRTLIERFSRRSEQIDQWLDTHGVSGIKASSAAAVATRAPKEYSESEESVYQRWGRELAEQGVGERQLAAVCSGGRGRPASRTELDAALDTLSGPDGLTGQASTFTRTDVVDALAKRLPVAPSAQEALSQVEAVADRFLEERAVRVAATAAWALTATRPRSCWPWSGSWSTAPPGGRMSAAPWCGQGLSVRSWTGTPPRGRTRRR